MHSFRRLCIPARDGAAELGTPEFDSDPRLIDVRSKNSLPITCFAVLLPPNYILNRASLANRVCLAGRVERLAEFQALFRNHLVQFFVALLQPLILIGKMQGRKNGQP